MTIHSPANVPKLEILIEATVTALTALGGSASNEEIHDEVVRQLNLPENIVEIPHKDGTKSLLVYKLYWARSFLKKVGAVDNTMRGVWTLTPLGRAMSRSELAQVAKKVRNLDAEARKLKTQIAIDLPELDNEDSNGFTIKNWREELLAALLAMTPVAFERLCQRILRESGFTKVEVTGRSGDGGIDGHGILRVKLVSFQVLFQSKRWQGSVGSNTVRDFRGAMVGRADKGLIFTTGSFTRDARIEATRDGAPAIDLVDGEDLCDLLRELNLGVKIKLVEEIEIDAAALAAI